MKKLLSLVTLALLLTGCSESVVQQSEIHEKFYHPSSTGTGVGVGSNGKVGVVTTSNAAKYELQLDSGIHSLSEDLWIQLEVGQTIEYEDGLFGIKNITIIEHADKSDEDEEV